MAAGGIEMKAIILKFLLVAMLVGVTIRALSGCGGAPTTATSWGSEQSRVTSPNGRLDAVLLRDDGGGAAGGWEWYVYIVAKGNRVDESKAHAILNAGTLTGGKLVWTQQHLLEIRYEIAGINQFRNLWGLSEIQDVGNSGQNDYLVEIRLGPASQDFSFLTANGEFKKKN
jgi:hypothetical protein